MILYKFSYGLDKAGWAAYKTLVAENGLLATNAGLGVSFDALTKKVRDNTLALLKNAVALLSTPAGIVVALAAITIGAVALFKAVDAATKSLEDYADAKNAAFSSVSDAESDLADVQTRLAEIRDRIMDIEGGDVSDLTTRGGLAALERYLISMQAV